MFSRPPRIGVNCDNLETARTASIGLGESYCRAVLAAGGAPIMIPFLENKAQREAILDAVDGFVLSGGDDLRAERLGEPLHPSAKPMSPERDRSDFLLIEGLIERRLPTLAICLGVQELNVFLGGTLHQDLSSLEAPGPKVTHKGATSEDRQVRHEARVEPESLLGRLWGDARSATVNSAHHQGIDKLGRGLTPIAWAPDGLVEAVQALGFPFLLGVQWHPERLMDEPRHAALFGALVLEAASRPAPLTPPRAG
jgi:putative glutamine amidotransferase